MKGEYRALLPALALLGALWAAPVYAGPPTPLVVSLPQPSGVTFAARVWGDEVSNGMETLDGYTIIQDPANGYWVYAARVASGNLVPASGPQGDLVVGTDSPRSLAKGIRPNRPVSADGSTRALLSAEGYTRPNIGIQKALVILVQFSDQSSVGTTASYWSNLFFGSTGSLKAYYSEVSYNQLTLAPAEETSGVANDGIVGWVTLPYAHPNAMSYPYIRDAIIAADPYVNYASFDTNGDGYLSFNELHITIVAAGYEHAYAGSSSCTPSIWGHEGSLPYGGVAAPVVDGKTVAAWVGNGGYTTLGEWHCAVGADYPGHAATMGPFAHELGHDLGLPDLYDVDGDTEGIGMWGLMGAGNWNYTAGGYLGNSPAHLDAWSKWYEGWLAPTQIQTTSPGQAIPQIETNPTAYLLGSNPGGIDWDFALHSGTGEYFLVENRQKVGFDAGLPSCGLLIWHIDESVTHDNNANADQTHRLVDLKQADGQNHLDILIAGGGNGGDPGDPYPGSANNRTFNGTSNPNSNLYGGTPSLVSVTNIGSCSASMTADLSATASSLSRALYLPITLSKPSSTSTGISGRVTFNGAPVGEVILQLRFYNGSTWSTRAAMSTAADGSFHFVGAPSLTGGQQYYVRYDNPDLAGGSAGKAYLWSWFTRSLFTYAAGDAVEIGNFDIADITMVSPASGATVPIPSTFQWNRRPLTSDNYRFHIFNPATPTTVYYTDNLGYTSSYQVNNLPPGYTAGTTYGWFPGVTTADGGWGGAHFYRYVRFSNAPLVLDRIFIPRWISMGEGMIPQFEPAP